MGAAAVHVESGRPAGAVSPPTRPEGGTQAARPAPKPWYEMSGTATAIITLIVLIAIMLYSGNSVQPALQEAKAVIIEEPLEKNSELMLLGGETYVYSYKVGNDSFNMTYKIASGPGCTVVRYEGDESAHACLDRMGNDDTRMNSTLGNILLVLFKPWMLAAHESWRWNTSMGMDFGGMSNGVTGMSYSTVRTEEFLGRRAYVVRISTSSEEDAGTFVWVDAEKRVLLKEMGSGYTVELVEGPIIRN